MSIDIIKGAGVTNLHGETGGATPISKSSQPSAHSSESKHNDAVSLTDTARALHHAETELAAEPAFDAERVLSLRVDVAHGTWQFDSSRVAEKLLRFEQALHP